MSTIRIRKHLESEMLHLPELRELIGHDVEITVVDSSELTEDAGRRFWQRRTLDQLAAEQGYVPRTFDEMKGPFTADDFEGFEEFLEEVRRPASPRESA